MSETGLREALEDAGAPTPWVLEGVTGDAAIRDANEALVVVPWPGLAVGEAIVRAVNAHDDLLAACRKFMRAWDSGAIGLWTEEDAEVFRNALAATGTATEGEREP